MGRREARNRRGLLIQSLERRALLAVITVAPQADDDPADLLADAIVAANATPEPDTIELAPAVYDLASLDEATLEISSEISIVGQSPGNTSILPEIGSRPLTVTSDGNLELSRVTVYSSNNRDSGVLLVDGSARLDQVAVIGMLDLDQGEVSLVTPLVLNHGTLVIKDSVLVDSPGFGIVSHHKLVVDGSLISGASTSAILQARLGENVDLENVLTVQDSVIFDNGAGIQGFGDLNVSASTITDNGNTVFSHNIFGAGGVSVFDPLGTASVNIDDNNIIIDNLARDVNSDVATWDGSDVERYSLGTSEQADARVADVTVDTEDGVLLSDEALEGVNVQLVTVGDQVMVEHSGRGTSSVFWSEAESRFFIESIARRFDDLYPIADALPILEAGRVIGSGSSKQFSADELFVDRDDLSAPEKNAWKFLDITSATSESGGSVHHWRNFSGNLNWFRYVPRIDFVGTDTITVTGTDPNGRELQGTISVDVVAKSGIILNVAASDLDDMIDVAISSSGFGTINSFRFRVTYNPLVVRPTGREFGRGYPFLQEYDDHSNGIIKVSALNGFSRGNDLVTLSFKRISEGSANIELSETGFQSSASRQDLAIGAYQQKYFMLSQEDTNRDGQVSASDALMVINKVSQVTATSNDGSQSGYARDLDVNGDRIISASDALYVINELKFDSIVEADAVEERHPVFAQAALEYLVTDGDIPDFVGRPGIPIDDGTPEPTVNLTPPTAAEFAAASLVNVDQSGTSTAGSLASLRDQDLYVIRGTGAQIGFGVTADDRDHRSLTVTIWKADGTLVDAYPTVNSVGFAGGAIDTVSDELIYIRIGTAEEGPRGYLLDLIELSSSGLN